MELGTAVFLSAVLLALVGLYAATKDRWNWKKVLLWPLAVLVGLAILTGSGVYLYSLIEARPGLQTEFWGIPVSSTEADVKFLKGEPTSSKDRVWVYKTDRSYGEPYYYIVQFAKTGKVRYVMYYGPSLEAPRLQGISGYSDQEEIVQKFGPPTHVSSSKDGLRRVLSYAAYNLAFSLEKNQVTGLGMYDGSGSPLDFIDKK